MSSVGYVGQTNPSCVCAGKGGFSCHALDVIDPGCGFGTCPFYKTHEDQAYAEMRCRRRLEMLHPEVKYKTRKEIMDELEKGQITYQKKLNGKKKATVIQVIYKGETTEYPDIPSASEGTGIHEEMIRLSLKKGEPIHGIEFKRR